MYFLSAMCILKNHESYARHRLGNIMRKSRRVLATGAALALVAAGAVTMVAPRSARADTEPFALSQYVSSTSTTVCNTAPVITTYHGTVVLDIPITTLLAGHEADIRAARVSEALCMRFNPQSRRRVRNNDCCVPEEA